MSLTLIAMTGILVGFLCLVIGFFMEDTQDQTMMNEMNGKRSKAAKKKTLVARRKAA